MTKGQRAPQRAPSWYRRPDAQALAWAAAQAGDGWRAVGTSRLRGGVAMAVDAIRLVGPSGATQRLVLKRWTRPGWSLEDSEFTPAREAAVLAALASTDVPAPRLVGVDPDGSASGEPAILMTHVDGRRPSLADEARPARITAMAAALAQIHDVRGPALAAVDPFRPWYPLDAVRIPARSRHPEWWQTALVLASSVPAATAPCFLHRDYHPANTIWRGGHLAGVVDWTSASTGQAAMDLAHWRANLGTRHGIEVADRVLPAYRAVTGGLPVAQPWWDVRIVLDFLDEPDAMAGDDLAGLEAYLGALLRRA